MSVRLSVAEGWKQMMDTIQIGPLTVSKFIIGGNPFSGFSHQTPERDRQMVRYWTTDRIKQVLRQAEELGVNTHFARADRHIIRVLMEYWDQGGGIQWIAQTCTEFRSAERAVQVALAGGAKACYLHGGYMDRQLAQGRMDEVIAAIAMIREAGVPAGVAGHNPKVFQWSEQNLDVDFYMCCYYNAANRDQQAEHVSGMAEWFRDEDRRIMTDLTQTLGRPVIHYKVLAAGRNDPKEAFAFVARCLRPQDAVCVGIHTQDNPDMLAEDVRLLHDALRDAGK